MTNARVQTIKHSLDPIFDAHSQVLVLGTMPSPKSREVSFYYGNPRNRFWSVMAALFDEPLPTTNERRTDLLLRHHIALWDVLAQCDIKGASDASIENTVPNDLSRILNAANIQAVFCTGAKSAELYRKLCEPRTKIPCVKLPSTSPANASWSLERLIGEYQALLSYLTPNPEFTLPVEEVAKLEQAIAARGTSLGELMERAGLWLAHHAHRSCPTGPVVILCGNGNNGGDGWVAARHLAQWGHPVAIACAKPPSEIRAEPARTAALATMAGWTEPAGQGGQRPSAHDANIEVLVNPSEAALAEKLGEARLAIDALLGTGFSGSTVKEPFAIWIELVNGMIGRDLQVIAADVPSGMSAETGEAALSTIYADKTVTMIVNKPGLTTPEARVIAGQVTVAPLAYLGPYLTGE